MTANDLSTKNDLKLLEDRIGKKIDQKIEEFAGQIISATAKGFDEVNGRLDKVENRLDMVEEGLREVKTNILDFKDNFNNFRVNTPTKQEFQNHEKRISRLEKTTFTHP